MLESCADYNFMFQHLILLVWHKTRQLEAQNYNIKLLEILIKSSK